MAMFLNLLNRGESAEINEAEAADTADFERRSHEALLSIPFRPTRAALPRFHTRNVQRGLGVSIWGRGQ